MFRFAISICLAVPCLWACAAGPTPKTAPLQALPESTSVDVGAFLLAPGDRVEIVVYSAPELSQELDVLPDGTLQMPYAGTIQAAARRPGEVEADLRDALSRELKDPDLALFVKTLGPHRSGRNPEPSLPAAKP